MVTTETQEVMHWTCPACHLEWLDSGRGFPGQRFSTCVRCGSETCEPDDATPSAHQAEQPPGAHAQPGAS
jgi:hypothetical protein